MASGNPTPTPDPAHDPAPEIARKRLRDLYFGAGNDSRIFRFVLILLDSAAIVYFLATVREESVGLYWYIDFALLCFFAAELALRLWIAQNRKAFWRQLTTWADVLVIVSLALPLVFANLGFMRILRTMRLIRAYRVADELKAWLPVANRHRDVIAASVNLAVFVFVVASVVWVLEARINPEMRSWFDALYYTVTTLTTTGFGDITLKDPLGRMLTVFIMIFGVALFLRLAQSIFRPFKVHYTCQSCGLQRHDPDASHCKHCGAIIHIKTDGEW